MKPVDWSPSGASFRRLLLRLFATRELVTLLFLPMAVYVDALLLDIRFSQQWRTVLGALALTYSISGLTLSLLVMGWLLHRALRVVPSEPEGRRLERLLALPWQLILLGNLLMWVLGGFILNATVAYLLGKSLATVLLGMAVAGGMGLINGTLLFILYERMLMPIAIEEFQRSPRARPASGNLFLPRQRWFLPYVLASLLFCSLLFTGTVVGVKLARWKDLLVEELARGGSGIDLAVRIEQTGAAFRHEVLVSVGATLALMVFGSATTVWWMGRRQRDGAAAVYASLEGLVHGSAQPPRWVSGDEMGDLAAGVWLLFDRLQELPRELRAATLRLAQAGAHLSQASGVQQRTLERQSAAIHETATTAEEIRQLSVLAQNRAQSVLTLSARAAELGSHGEMALSRSIQWLDGIATTTEHIRLQVGQLEQHAREIDRVVQTVKTLADRSNLLALNGAIQAAHSGEYGRSFAVVAKEFRGLADLSLQATHEVRAIIDELGTALRVTVSMVERGTHGVTEALARLGDSRAPMHEMALLVQRSATAMRELTQAVGQQHLGIDQLFQATHELLSLTEDTLAHQQATRQAALTCDEVSGQVGEIARRYAVAEPSSPPGQGKLR